MIGIDNRGWWLRRLVACVALGVASCSGDAGREPDGDAPAPTVVAGLPRAALPAATAARVARRSTVAEPAAPAAFVPVPVDTSTAGAPGPRRIDPATVTLQSGHAYWVQLPIEWLAFASDQADPQRSTLVVKEDGVALGPGNSALLTVQRVGRGSFLHWGSWLYFSSSDNTDPRTNGRKYRAMLR